MAKVYSLKENFTFEEFEEIGYSVFPNEQKIIKVVEQPLDGKAVESILNQYYRNPKWKEEIYDKNPSHFIKELGLKYNKNGDIKMTKKFQEVLKSWLIQIDLSDDLWIGFTSFDWYDQHVFFACSILDEFCKDEIEILKEHNLIEVIEVEN
jgi:hypothetical protein